MPDDGHPEAGAGRAAALHEAGLLGEGVDPTRLAPILERCPERRLSRGDVLLSPEQANHSLHILTEGTLAVRLSSPTDEAGFHLESGECVGEMSIVDGSRPSAWVVAEDESRVLEIPEEVFWDDIAPLPGVARNLLRVMADRLRRRNAVLARALEQELRLQHLEKELQVARELQASMLPREHPLFPDHPGVDVGAAMVPARAVGGDFYDAFPLDAERVCVSVGDVSGKGMPAALFMVRTLTLMRIEMLRGGRVGEALARVNAALSVDNPSCMFASIFVAVVNVGSGAVDYASAGHNPPLTCLADAGVGYLAVPKGIIAGIDEDATYPTRHLDLASGDLLLLYTDGVTEAENPALEQYSPERLVTWGESTALDDAETVVAALQEDVERFADGAAQSDDITILALRKA
jgi:sigma-B regulation protein RsbU (phosphoserine phosphatase)